MQTQSSGNEYVKHVKQTDALRFPRGDAFASRTICYRHRVTDLDLLACYILQSRTDIPCISPSPLICSHETRHSLQ